VPRRWRAGALALGLITATVVGIIVNTSTGSSGSTVVGFLASVGGALVAVLTLVVDRGRRSRHPSNVDGDVELLSDADHLLLLESSASGDPALRQAVIDLACAILRSPGSELKKENGRQAAQQVLSRHVRRGPQGSGNDAFWTGLSIDLRGAVLDNLNLAYCEVRRATFEGARFSGFTTFRSAKFGDYALFSGATFEASVDFELSDHMGDAAFDGVTFAGVAFFADSRFRGDAIFAMATCLRKVDFKRARFDGDVTFRSAAFHERASFEGSAFEGSSSFEQALFLGDADFSGCRFGGTATFAKSEIKGDISFDRAVLSSGLNLTSDRLNGTISLEGAQVRSPEPGATVLRIDQSPQITLADTLLRQGRYAEAESWLRQNAESGDWIASSRLASLYLTMNHLEAAEAWSRRAGQLRQRLEGGMTAGSPLDEAPLPAEDG
jgi:uncharacterized protein YjbI with pentapeptide repeats